MPTQEGGLLVWYALIFLKTCTSLQRIGLSKGRKELLARFHVILYTPRPAKESTKTLIWSKVTSQNRLNRWRLQKALLLQRAMLWRGQQEMVGIGSTMEIGCIHLGLRASVSLKPLKIHVSQLIWSFREWRLCPPLPPPAPSHSLKWKKNRKLSWYLSMFFSPEFLFTQHGYY